jgi:hypothetical protein
VPFRVSYHEIAARATRSVPREALARAVERLSVSYREGRPGSVHRSRAGRAAYLVHVLPAHVCDERRLFLDEFEDALRRPVLRVLALGAGPGTEALALADAWAHLAARDGRAPGELLRVERADLVADWDESFAALRSVAEDALRGLDPTLGTAWVWDAPEHSLTADLARPVAPELAALAREADLILAANLLSELEPRSTPALPASFLENLALFARSAPAGASIVLLDRGHAPGVPERFRAALDAIGRSRAAAISGPHERETRCACALTRETKALYAKVRLPTTKVEDRPILTTRTLWARAELD